MDEQRQGLKSALVTGPEKAHQNALCAGPGLGAGGHGQAVARGDWTFLAGAANSPPKMRRGTGAQRHGGGLTDLPVTLIQAFPVEYANSAARNG